MGILKRIAPIFPTSDLDAALEHYRRLGFQVRKYDKAEYGYATWDDVEIHLGSVPGGRSTGPASAYLFVENADELAQRWISAGADIRLPQDTAWGQREGALIDLDGNIIRFGSVLVTQDELPR